MGNLTHASIKAVLSKPGRYRDKDGLMLFVSKPGLASWVVRIQKDKKRRDYGLGSLKLVSLSEAREKARQVKKALVENRDPHAIGQIPSGMQRIFRETAIEFIERKFTGPTREQARARLTTYVVSSLGKLQLQSIDAQRIALCLEPIWQLKPETALRVRALIIRTMRYGRPDGPSLAGTLARAISDILPKQISNGSGFAALPWPELPAFMSRLAEKPGMGALALQATILTAARSGEIRGATWDELDFDDAVWTIPKERMKVRKLHKVPLSAEALQVFRRAAELRRGNTNLVFPNGKGELLSDMTLTKCLRDMGESDTVHGFRSTFRDFVAEQLLDVPDEIAEAALAHTVSDKVMKAYKRTTFFEMRRSLMTTWGRFCSSNDGEKIMEIGEVYP